MNYFFKIMVVAGVICLGTHFSTIAASEKAGGPKGGRLLENDSPRAEFYVKEDHSVTITFYDGSLKPAAVTDQSVRVIADAPDGKVTLEFEKKGDVLTSIGKLPEGHGYNLVIQVRKDADSKLQNFRLVFEKDICGGCNRTEYACICGH